MSSLSAMPVTLRGCRASDRVLMLRRPVRAVSKHAARSVARPSFETPARCGLLRMRSKTLRKRLDAGDGAAEDQRMDIMCALIGVDGFQVRGVAHHVILDLDAVA